MRFVGFLGPKAILSGGIGRGGTHGIVPGNDCTKKYCPTLAFGWSFTKPLRSRTSPNCIFEWVSLALSSQHRPFYDRIFFCI
jgi:hypothetical protein